MANIQDVRVRKFPVRLNGEDKTLVYDLNAFAEIEEIYGDIDEAMKKMEGGSPKALRILLWAGLIHEEEELTVKQVGKMLDMQGLTALTGVLMEGLSGHTVQPEQVAKLEALQNGNKEPVNVLAQPPGEQVPNV